eukprot:CAMPEP_0175706208 /NCGR_PEP_ID=MMETSP0097-20121207/37928_1 /TAXON_ID=311494 /ORGANISM="Alexandrium monilatum, Strain CCMP3105" /LENGTH=209 /DNA_ID=CAMNT_0017013549 /DNA_START=59 /DNA_END=686 /DNA_ORIENTATION=+
MRLALQVYQHGVPLWSGSGGPAERVDERDLAPSLLFLALVASGECFRSFFALPAAPMPDVDLRRLPLAGRSFLPVPPALPAGAALAGEGAGAGAGVAGSRAGVQEASAPEAASGERDRRGRLAVLGLQSSSMGSRGACTPAASTPERLPLRAAWHSREPEPGLSPRVCEARAASARSWVRPEEAPRFPWDEGGELSAETAWLAAHQRPG